MPSTSTGDTAVVPFGFDSVYGLAYDPGTDTWTATVDYGDGSGSQALPLTGKTFELSHVYADNGSYTVTVTVNDDDGGSGLVLRGEDVARRPPHLRAQGDQRLDEYRGLHCHVQRAGDAHPGQRLIGCQLVPHRHESRHLVLGEPDLLAAELGQHKKLAERRVKLGLLLAELGRKKEIEITEVSEEELAESLVNGAGMVSGERVPAYLDEPDVPPEKIGKLPLSGWEG